MHSRQGGFFVQTRTRAAMRMSAVDTMILSATGSRNAPKADVILSCRKKKRGREVREKSGSHPLAPLLSSLPSLPPIHPPHTHPPGQVAVRPVRHRRRNEHRRRRGRAPGRRPAIKPEPHKGGHHGEAGKGQDVGRGQQGLAGAPGGRGGGGGPGPGGGGAIRGLVRQAAVVVGPAVDGRVQGFLRGARRGERRGGGW